MDQWWGGGCRLLLVHISREFFYCLGLINVYFVPPYNQLAKIDIVLNVIASVPDDNGISSNVSIGFYFNGPDGVLITVVPDLIIMGVQEQLDAEHIFDSLVGGFYFTIYIIGISSSVIHRKFIIKSQLCEFSVQVKLSTFFYP